jgi:hypothetical protein
VRPSDVDKEEIYLQSFIIGIGPSFPPICDHRAEMVEHPLVVSKYHFENITSETEGEMRLSASEVANDDKRSEKCGQQELDDRTAD